MFSNQLDKDDMKEHIESLEKQAEAEEKERQESGVEGECGG